ncbi:hypothetical protein BLNAU_23252 [Blattamonas nauphoetae]|uniref:Uncharacterized protein n=1 Tax=Blattamonas nauphoetae TaxID=2049346 RepID=A0ABQ9WTT1_9EUKA|nr:hypothetical protein BLNAU_23252 [Blattamonas nauphoetae]
MVIICSASIILNNPSDKSSSSLSTSGSLHAICCQRTRVEEWYGESLTFSEFGLVLFLKRTVCTADLANFQLNFLLLLGLSGVCFQISVILFVVFLSILSESLPRQVRVILMDEDDV